MNGLDVCERFLSIIEVLNSQKAIGIVAAILIFLEQSSMKYVKVITQSYVGPAWWYTNFNERELSYPYAIYVLLIEFDCSRCL